MKTYVCNSSHGSMIDHEHGIDLNLIYVYTKHEFDNLQNVF